MDIQADKKELIKMIAAIESERLIIKLKKFLQREIKNEPNGTPNAVASEPDEPAWVRLAREPMPDTLDVDAIAKEQGYDGNRLMETLRNWDQTPFEDQTLKELLNSLTK